MSKHVKPIAAKIPPVVVPPLTSPSEYGRFVYIPGEGIFIGNEHTWYPRTPSEPHWIAFQKSPRWSQWLMEHPMSVLYGVLEDGKLFVCAISSGGTLLTHRQVLDSTRSLSQYIPTEPAKSGADEVEVGLEADPKAETYVQGV